MARDDRLMFSVDSALNSGRTTKLDPDIKLYFGKQKTPPIEKTIGEYPTNKKTNAFGKSDNEACEWAFLSAIIALQERAAREGGNAVVNIKSNYKSEETSSETEYMCGAGSMMAGVALKGTVVKLKPTGKGK
jgi:uncharacterized protein YbjQ (UPF0145 family)